MPAPREREWLESELARLIGREGWQPFVSAPLLTANDQWFPGPCWEENAEAAGWIARRLLALAGLERPRVRVLDYTGLIRERKVESPQLFFTGRDEEGVVEFEVHVLGRSDDLIATLTHEAAAAWLDHRMPDGGAHPFREAPAADETAAAARASVAAVYLGFGAPATNAAQTARHGGETIGNTHTMEWEIWSHGGLSPAAMSYLLALQLAVRDRAPERRRVLASLHPNQRTEVEQFLGELDGPVVERKREQLGLPPRDGWPEPGRAPAHDPRHGDDIEVVCEVEPQEVRQFNRGEVVFRVRQTHTFAYGFAGAFVGFMAFIGTLGRFSSVPLLLAVVVAPIVAGALLGARHVVYECSSVSCRRRLSKAAETCPGCGGAVSGEIANANQRLEAEERLLAGGDSDDDGGDDGERR